MATLFLVEHVEHALIGHYLPQLCRTSLQIILQVSKHQVPQPTITALEGVLTCLCVVSVSIRRIYIYKEAVIALAKLSVSVIVGDLPFQSVPRAKHHVLCPLIN